MVVVRGLLCRSCKKYPLMQWVCWLAGCMYREVYLILFWAAGRYDVNVVEVGCMT